jgi:cysteine desulfurase family protein (TIGR01976 family)|tara:strand:+ start:24383 stop:25609 length:1227 start_codon:yes stop_codon:yes gene_type:complete
MSVVSTEEIRGHFPALQRTHAGYPVGYFDGPGGTQVPTEVIEAFTDYLLRHNANTDWKYPSSIETDQFLKEARVTFADFLKCSEREIVFGNNMTTLTYHLSRTLGKLWGPGDEIIVTQLDHQANQAPWHSLEEEYGVTVHTVPMLAENGKLDWDTLTELFTRRTRLLAIGGASNALGTVNDLDQAARLCRSFGAYFFVDAVHMASHMLMDVVKTDCDFLACSSYKFYGPHAGILYIRKNVGESLMPPRLPCAKDYLPESFETGTLNHEGIVGAAAAVDFLAGLSESNGSRRDRLEAVFSTLYARSHRLLGFLWDGLQEQRGVQLYGPGPGEERTPTIGFTVKGVDSSTVAERLANDFGLFLSHGDFYATGVTEALGLGQQGLVRAGCACYTNEDEVERLIKGVAALCS